VTDEPRFKLLIYVHHVKTASKLRPRAGSKDSAGRELLRRIRRLMLNSRNKIARQNKDLFSGGRLSTPLPSLQDILTRQGWTIKSLAKSNRALLLGHLSRGLLDNYVFIPDEASHHLQRTNVFYRMLSPLYSVADLVLENTD
jgi:hypothetical protein